MYEKNFRTCDNKNNGGLTGLDKLRNIFHFKNMAEDIESHLDKAPLHERLCPRSVVFIKVCFFKVYSN